MRGQLRLAQNTSLVGERGLIAFPKIGGGLGYPLAIPVCQEYDGDNFRCADGPTRDPCGGLRHRGDSMAKNIYVGNLVWECTNEDLIQLFQQHGTVKSAQVVMDRDTGRSRGFGFVEMSNDEEADRAIAALNGFQYNGRDLTVNEAKPREPRPPRHGGGGGGGGGYGGRR